MDILQPSSSSVPIGAIVGGAVGGVVILGLLGLLIVFIRRRRHKASPAGGPVLPLQRPSSGATDKLAGTSSKELESSMVSSPGRLPPGSPLLDTLQPRHGSGITSNGSGSGGIRGMLDSDTMLGKISSILATQHTARPGGSSQHLSGASSNASVLAGDPSIWEIKWQELSIYQAIGRGSYGWVYRAQWRRTTVAVKVLIDRDASPESTHDLELPEHMMQDLQQEAAIMARLRHPNCVSFMGLCVLPPALITEYCERGSLFDVLRGAATDRAQAATLTWPRRISLALDAARGLLFLHSHSILHRDVKSPNLLVDEHWRVKVSDFNLSKIVQEQTGSSSLESAGVHNPTWLAPEILQGNRATAASDVYSFALVLFEILTWSLPWAKEPGYAVVREVLSGGRPTVPPPDELPGEDTQAFSGLDTYCDLMRACWAQSPGDRPAFDDIVARLEVLQAGFNS